MVLKKELVVKVILSGPFSNISVLHVYTCSVYICVIFVDCDCHAIGSISSSCESTLGQCNCKHNVAGRACDQCKVCEEVLAFLV